MDNIIAIIKNPDQQIEVIYDVELTDTRYRGWTAKFTVGERVGVLVKVGDLTDLEIRPSERVTLIDPTLTSLTPPEATQLNRIEKFLIKLDLFCRTELALRPGGPGFPEPWTTWEGDPVAADKLNRGEKEAVDRWEAQAREIFETWEKSLAVKYQFVGRHNEVDILVKMIAAKLKQEAKDTAEANQKAMLSTKILYEG